jgi:hypothetical protein
VPVGAHSFAATDRLRRRPQRLICHRCVPPHHPLGLPAQEPGRLAREASVITMALNHGAEGQLGPGVPRLARDLQCRGELRSPQRFAPHARARPATLQAALHGSLLVRFNFFRTCCAGEARWDEPTAPARASTPSPSRRLSPAGDSTVPRVTSRRRWYSATKISAHKAPSSWASAGGSGRRRRCPRLTEVASHEPLNRRAM